ncbi:MAG: hypothetical protein ACXACO_18310 [Promethearchaeota archaeon]
MEEENIAYKSKVKDYTWTFPLFGGLLIIFALLTPSAFYFSKGRYYNLWAWGLLVYKNQGSNHLLLVDSNIFYFTSIISSIIIIICAFLLISTGVVLKKNIKRNIQINRRWKLPAWISIITMMIWMIIFELNTTMFISGEGSGDMNVIRVLSFWGIFHPGFGVFGVFLGGLISIIGSIMEEKKFNRMIYSKNEIIAKIKENPWIFPCLGGILLVIGLFTPAFYHSELVFDINYNFSFWMGGLYSYYIYNPSGFNRTEEGILFTNKFNILIPSIICFMILLGCAILIIKLAKKMKDNPKYDSNIKNNLVAISLILVIVEIGWIVLVTAPYISFLKDSYVNGSMYQINYNSPGLGIISVFLCVIFNIIGIRSFKGRITKSEIPEPQTHKINRISKIEFKKYIWILPFLGGIIVFITLLTPVAIAVIPLISPIAIVEYFTTWSWMWGLSYNDLQGFWFWEGFPLQILSILCTIVIGVCALCNISLAKNLRKNSKKKISIKKKGVIPSVIIIITAILWIVLVDLGFNYIRQHSFWDLFYPSFGIYGIFIGAGTSLSGFYSSLISKREKPK